MASQDSAPLPGLFELIARIPGPGDLPRRGRTNQHRTTPWGPEDEPGWSPERAPYGPGDVSPLQGSLILIPPDPRPLSCANLWLHPRGPRSRCRHRCDRLVLPLDLRAQTEPNLTTLRSDVRFPQSWACIGGGQRGHPTPVRRTDCRTGYVLHGTWQRLLSRAVEYTAFVRRNRDGE